MYVKQVSIFLENRSGRMAEVAHLLGEANINIRALSLAETANYGVLRLIVDQYEKAKEILQKAEITVQLTDVIVIEIPDVPGGLASVLDKLNECKLNVEYMYVFIERQTDQAVAVFRFENIDRAEELIKKSGIKFLPASKVYNI